MAGKPEAVSPEPEIVSKKGKIPSREANEKSVLVPTRKLKFLGFILDSERMIVSLIP